MLKKVTDEDGQTFILHIEFQVANEQKMVHRMIDYYNMLYWQYNIPVRQYVIYIGSEDSLVVVQDIVRQIIGVSEGFQRLRLLKQLRVLGQLRIYGGEIFDVMALTIESFWKEENDIFYQRGEAKGEAKGKGEVIRNLLSTGKFTVLEIANLAGVSNDFVEKVKTTSK